MTKKLDFEYDNHSGEYCALVGENYRVRAVPDTDPTNPFEDDESNWPLSVIPDHSSRPEEYLSQPGDDPYRTPLDRFSDAELVHMQHHILQALNSTYNADASNAQNMRDAMEAYVTEDPVGYVKDPEVLRDLFNQIVGDMSERDQLDRAVEVYYLLGIHAYRGTAMGYSQGDQSEVLVVATPEAVARFGCEKHIYELELEVKADPAILVAMARLTQRSPAEYDAALKRHIYHEVSEKLLKPTAKLYEDWAFGNIYGYVVEKREPVLTCPSCYTPWIAEAAIECAECGAEIEPTWEEVPDGSCWGFYGSDFAESGLEEAALDCIPDEELTDAVS